MRTIIYILLLSIKLSFGQTDTRFERNFTLNELSDENLLNQYSKYNFSNILNQTENSAIFGIIGENHQRIKIKLISIEKNVEKPNEYLVSGKSNVKGNICGFEGIIRILENRELLKMHFGCDDIFKDKKIKSQGVLTAEYEFTENKKQQYTGVFKGKLYSRWYLNSSDNIEYDNIEKHSSGYMNNAFIGTWKSHTSSLTKMCNWGDSRVPKPNKNFDIGSGEFSPNKQYYEFGWEVYSQAWNYQNKEAKKEELYEWWK